MRKLLLNFCSSYRMIVLVLLLTSSINISKAQYLRSSYFMKDHHFGIKLNPANIPNKGYLSIPLIGSIGITSNSDLITPRNLENLFKDPKYFTKNINFINSLGENQKSIINTNMDLISVGWWSGKGFWSFNLGLSTDAEINSNKSLFNLIQDNEKKYIGRRALDYNLDGINYNLSSFFDLGLGYSREISKRLTVGGRVKFLLGAIYSKLSLENGFVRGYVPTSEEILRIRNSNYTTAEDFEHLKRFVEQTNFTLRAAGELEAYTSFVKYSRDEKGNITGIKLDLKDGTPIGYGTAFDLGVNYKLLNNLKISLALTDIGFYKITSSNGVRIKAKDYQLEFDKNKFINREYNTKDDALSAIDDLNKEVQKFKDIVAKGDIYENDVLKTEDIKSEKGNSIKLKTKFCLGAEYSIMKDEFSLGVLYTGHLREYKTHNELTISANYRPSSFFNITASYSVLKSLGKTFGAAVKLGPIFLGTDYVYLNKDTNHINAVVGITINLKGRRAN